MQGQMTIFDFLDIDTMYDGYRIKESRTINFSGMEINIRKGDICYLVTKNNECARVSIPNNYGGSYGLPIPIKHFQELFEKLNRKVYPKSKEIWNGKAWIPNPAMC